MGPWYALKEQKGQVFYSDRAYWGDPDCVSLCWMYNGVKIFDWSDKPKRVHPVLKPRKSGKRTVIMWDYGMDGQNEADLYPNSTIRRHPEEVKPAETLEECLQRHDRAVGRHTTALVDAAIEGLHIECTASNGPLSGLTDGREHWINCLAWHNWHIDEIESGKAWSHLYQCS